jgi:small-conductance mechanosensitive channel
MADTQVTNAIDSMDEVSASVLATALDIWAAFIAHVPYLIAGLLVLLLTVGAVSLVSNLGARLLQGWHKRESIKELILRLLGIVIWILGLLLVAIIVFPGLTPSKALGGLGLVSIAVGLAFKDIFENFFAGILILWRFPFEHGDFIECKDIVGRVEKVLVRMTYIRETTGELVVVPNSFLFKNPVRILTNPDHRRVTIMLGVSYGDNLDAAIECVENTMRGCETVSLVKVPEIYPAAFGSSSIDIEVSWWTSAIPANIRKSRAEVVAAVKRALDEAGIDIPFPNRTISFLASGEEKQPGDFL